MRRPSPAANGRRRGDAREAFGRSTGDLRGTRREPSLVRRDRTVQRLREPADADRPAVHAAGLRPGADLTLGAGAGAARPGNDAALRLGSRSVRVVRRTVDASVPVRAPSTGCRGRWRWCRACRCWALALVNRTRTAGRRETRRRGRGTSWRRCGPGRRRCAASACGARRARRAGPPVGAPASARYARTASKAARLRASRLNSTATRWIGYPRWRYLSA